MARSLKKLRKPIAPVSPLAAVLEQHLEALALRNFSPYTLHNRRVALGFFLNWCHERGLREPLEITRPVIESYQRYLFYYRQKKSGAPLSFPSQYARLSPLRVWFRWMARERLILHNPASEVELPRLGARLPKHVLSVAEAERVLATPDISTPLGLRDRAMLETLYSTGVRRSELIRLKVYDLDHDRGTLAIREGKGRKDRIIPIGDRAVAWIGLYFREARPQLADEPDDGTLFVNHNGGPLSPDHLTDLVRQYVDDALCVDGKASKRGSCHLFRHTMATLMLQGGADIRYIQAMLGHSDLSTTEIYTQVSIRALKQIHSATHPGQFPPAHSPGYLPEGQSKPSEKPDTAGLLAALETEAEEEEEA